MTPTLPPRTLIALSLAALAGCATPHGGAPTGSQVLSGCWEGRDYQPVLGQRAAWRMNRRSDGSFEIEFRAAGGAPQRETGRWRVDGSTYTTITLTVDEEPVDPQDPQFTDVYQLMKVSADSMIYLHRGLNMSFRSVRVACPGDA